MPTGQHPGAEPHFVTFGVLRTDGPETAGALVETLVRETREWVRHCAGFRSARVHVGTDGTTVVNRGEWSGASAYRTSFESHERAAVLQGLAGHPGVRAASVFRGSPAPGIDGPETAARPGIAVVAVRHLRDAAATAAVLGLLAESGAWKRTFPGFVSATPYVSEDGTTYINYPMWVSEEAYRSWMADPRIAEGQEEIARLEAAPPEYILCTVAAQTDRPAQARRDGTNRY
jgi:quinol monooxygenase YgiN